MRATRSMRMHAGLPNSASATTSRAERIGDWLGWLGWILAIACVIARSTFTEAIAIADPVIPGPLAAPRSAGATAGLLMDLLAAFPAILVLARAVINPKFRIRHSPAGLFLMCLACLALASGFWAPDKFSTTIQSIHLLSAASLAWAVSQLVRSWFHVRLLAAACIAIMMVNLAQGIIYRFVDHPDIVRYWEQNGAAELAQRGWSPDSFQARQYRTKILSGEVYGFNASPNSYAALLVMLGATASGLVVQRIRDRDEPGWAAALLVPLILLPMMLHFTGSRAALITSGFASILFCCAPLLRRLGRKVYFLGAISFSLGVAALLAHGMYHGSLIHDSLTFRWRYWIGAFRVFVQHAFLGVGWGDFGLFYVGARLPIATEEIKDPHNLLVRFFVELGLVGGLLGIAWIARLMWEITSPSHPPILPTTARPARTIVAVCVLGIVLNILASIDFFAASSGATGYAILELIKRGLFLFLMLLGMAVAILRDVKHPVLDDRPAPWVLYAMVVGIAVFLIHNLLDFPFAESGPLCVFAMMIGGAIGARGLESSRPLSPILAIGGLIFAGILWIGVAAAIVVPIARAEALAHNADNLLRANQPAQAAKTLEEAFDSLWIPNGDYAFRAANAIRFTQVPPEQRIPLLDAAINANPMRVVYLRMRAEAEASRAAPDIEKLIQLYSRAIELDPNDLNLHRDFADEMVRNGRFELAIEQYKSALAHNDAFSPDEPERFTEAQLAEIKGRISLLEKR